MDLKFLHFDELDSTNSYALRLLQVGNDLRSLNGTVISAATQTAGRGRMNRPFYSPQSTGIYLSFIFVPPDPVQEPAVLTATAAVVVVRAIKRVFNVDSQIKWVNDVYIDGKKVCGILTEGFVDYRSGKITAAVVGIGVNISTDSFPGALAEKAGSITKKTDSSIFEQEADSLLKEIALGLSKTYESELETGKAMAEYRQKSFLVGKTVEVCPVINSAGGHYRALVLGISDRAELMVRTESGEELCLDSGEVSVLL